MADPYIGEIRLFAGTFAPVGWADCSGQVLAISEYDALFNLIGTTYGGDGQSTFQLPDLRGRAPLHMGQGPGASYVIGESGGVESVTLTKNQTGHGHYFQASMAQGTARSAGPTLVVAHGNATPYVQDVISAAFAPSSILPQGKGQPHENRQPFLTTRFIISLDGIYPPSS